MNSSTPLMVPPSGEETYLGDGLYVSFTGWDIRFRAPRESGDHWIALEPEAWRTLRHWLDTYPEMKRHMDGEP